MSLPTIPPDDVLTELSEGELRELASEYHVPGDDTGHAIRCLSRLRDGGGAVMGCPREACGYVWVYKGDYASSYKTTCPVCTTSVTLRQNTIASYDEDGEREVDER